MPHYLGLCNSRPDPKEKRALITALEAIDPNLVLVVSKSPGEAPCYVKAPDIYGASEMKNERDKVNRAVRNIMRDRCTTPE